MSSLTPTLSLLLIAAVARAEIATQPADRFADSVGVCTHWTYPDTPYGFAFEKVKQRLVQSGIRQVRDGFSDRLVELGKLGIRATVLVDADKPIAASLEAIKKPRLNFEVQPWLVAKEALIGCFVAMSFSGSVV